jgi:hypothetical protein
MTKPLKLRITELDLGILWYATEQKLQEKTGRKHDIIGFRVELTDFFISRYPLWLMITSWKV